MKMQVALLGGTNVVKNIVQANCMLDMDLYFTNFESFRDYVLNIGLKSTKRIIIIYSALKGIQQIDEFKELFYTHLFTTEIVVVTTNESFNNYFSSKIIEDNVKVIFNSTITKLNIIDACSDDLFKVHDKNINSETDFLNNLSSFDNSDKFEESDYFNCVSASLDDEGTDSQKEMAETDKQEDMNETNKQEEMGETGSVENLGSTEPSDTGTLESINSEGYAVEEDIFFELNEVEDMMNTKQVTKEVTSVEEALKDEEVEEIDDKEIFELGINNEEKSDVKKVVQEVDEEILGTNKNIGQPQEYKAVAGNTKSKFLGSILKFKNSSKGNIGSDKVQEELDKVVEDESCQQDIDLEYYFMKTRYILMTGERRTGKTRISWNIANTLAVYGIKTLYIDMDKHKGLHTKLKYLSGEVDSKKKGLKNFMAGRDIKDVAVEYNNYLDILGLDYDVASEYSINTLIDALAYISSEYKAIIIDSSNEDLAVLNTTFKTRFLDIINVMDNETVFNTIQDLEKIKDIGGIKVVLNKVRSKDDIKQFNEVADYVEIDADILKLFKAVIYYKYSDKDLDIMNNADLILNNKFIKEVLR